MCSIAKNLCLLVLSALAVTSTALAEDARTDYPQTKRVDHVDTYHGTEVPDPYRWLEQDVRQSPEVAAWVEAENKVTFAYLEAIPQREAILRRMTELWDYAKYSSPMKEGGRALTNSLRI